MTVNAMTGSSLFWQNTCPRLQGLLSPDQVHSTWRSGIDRALLAEATVRLLKIIRKTSNTDSVRSRPDSHSTSLIVSDLLALDNSWISLRIDLTSPRSLSMTNLRTSSVVLTPSFPRMFLNRGSPSLIPIRFSSICRQASRKGRVFVSHGSFAVRIDRKSVV